MNLRSISNKNRRIRITLVVIMLLVTLVITSCSFTALQSSTSQSMSNEMVLDPDKLARIDAWLSQTGEDGAFSGSVLIAEKGQVLLSRGYGLADREQKIPNAPQTRFRLGSITKQFTAMAILILQSQGRLNVKEPICRYIEDCPAAWEDTTIHHLMTHTSGMIVMPADSSYPKTPLTPLELMERFKDAPLDFQPGEKFSYSNCGYWVLGYIIEQVSSQSYKDFIQQAIFEPLEMHDSGYDQNARGLAVGYVDQLTATPVEVIDSSFPYSAGALYSTVEDLYRWDQALYTERLLPQAELDRMFSPIIQETNITGFGYGYGWYVGEDQGRVVVGHGGNIEGFATLIIRYPDDQITLIVLMNQADLNQLSVWAAISNAIFGEAHACGGSSDESRYLVSAAELRVGGYQ